MNETRYLPGSPRLFNNHSVCTECGAMIDNEFIAAHEVSHGREMDLTLASQIRRKAEETRQDNVLRYKPAPKKERRAERWHFRLWQ